MRLSALRLRVPDPGGLAGFYRDKLGMRVKRQGANWRVGYGGQDADLLLMPKGRAYCHDRGQRFWKIGLTLPDVDLAAAQLRGCGVAVTAPQQFLDIGYMCHLSDPNGFVIELLQHDFRGNRPDGAADPAAPFAMARVGQITLRTGDIAAEQEICDALGMKCLSIQDVAPHGFDLHFFAFSDDTPPDPDLWAVGNREWVWKRPYTTLEFQHVPGMAPVPVPDYRGIEVEGLPSPLADAAGDPILPG